MGHKVKDLKIRPEKKYFYYVDNSSVKQVPRRGFTGQKKIVRHIPNFIRQPRTLYYLKKDANGLLDLYAAAMKRN